MENHIITIEMTRKAVRSFCKSGKQVSNAQLYAAMGIESRRDKNNLRNYLRAMIQDGELTRISAGLFAYNPNYHVKINETFAKLWRFVRTQKPGWSAIQASQMTAVPYSTTRRYFIWLEDEGYIEQQGRDSKRILYRTTIKADSSPEVPFQPLKTRNPFEKESAAAAELTRLMLCNDPYQPAIARKIVANCNVLLNRFDKKITQNKNEGEKL